MQKNILIFNTTLIEIVNLFPGSTFGPDFVKAIKGPRPWTSIKTTGGVSTEESNLKAGLDAGVTCFSMGSKLISKDIIGKGDFEKLTEEVKSALTIIQGLQNK